MSTKRKCNVAGCEQPGTKVCTGCGEVGYCSKEHQVADWKNHKMSCKQKHKAAVPAARGEEIPVTWEDQQHINEFSRLNLQLSKLDDELKTKKNDAENLKDASTDIESLLDDDACKVRIGEVFMDVTNEEAEEFVTQQQKASTEKLAQLQERRVELIKKMDVLKGILSTKFKNQINLENSDQTRDD